MNDLIIVEQFYGFACVSAWGGGREADADGGGRERVRALCFCLFWRQTCKGRRIDFRKHVATKVSTQWRRLRCYLFFYDTTFQSFCQGCGDKALMLLTVSLSRGIQGKILTFPYNTLDTEEGGHTRTLSPFTVPVSFVHVMPFKKKKKKKVRF